VNRIFGLNPTQVSLFDKKADQLYIYRADQSLQLGDTSAKTLGSVILKHVLAYKPYGKDLITYVTDNNQPAGTVAARIWDKGSTYKLNEFPAGAKYLIDVAQYQGDFYYAAGSDTADRINVYKNPLDQIQDPSSGRALPQLALNISGAQKIGFSDNTRFIGAENGQRFAVYDFETQSSYLYSLTDPLSDNLSWMDGHRYFGNSDGKVFVMDYDGTNKQLLSATVEPYGGLFSSSYTDLLTLTRSPDGASFSLQDTDMRAGKDLPKTKQNL
jgi:hypothetical protein